MKCWSFILYGNQIHIDIPRMNPSVTLFQQKTVQEVRMLGLQIMFGIIVLHYQGIRKNIIHLGYATSS